MKPTKGKARLVHRATAERALAGFMQRVKEANENPEFGVTITEVVVFGSYLGDKPMLGDLDLAIKYTQRGWTAVEEWKHFRETAPASYPSTLAVFWPARQVVRFLKNRQRTISLHDLGDDVEIMIRQVADFRFEVLLGDREAILKRAREPKKWSA